MRYRFDSVAQARKHLHPLEARQILFFPDPFLDVRDGQPIQLELCFMGSEQSVTVRGQVHAVETGAMRGAWLDLFSLRIGEGLHIACTNPRRLFRRVASDLMVRVQKTGAPGTMARLIEVSAGGARLAGGGGRWMPGDDLYISELSGWPMRARVVRAREGELAIPFSRADATTRRNGVRLVEAALQRWNDARETRHPAACGCMNGGALYEPLLPRASHRRVEGL